MDLLTARARARDAFQATFGQAGQYQATDGTLTTIHPIFRFGVQQLNEDGYYSSITECHLYRSAIPRHPELNDLIHYQGSTYSVVGWSWADHEERYVIVVRPDSGE